MNFSNFQGLTLCCAAILAAALPSASYADTENEVEAKTMVPQHKYAGYEVIIFDTATIERINSQSAMTKPAITPQPGSAPKPAPDAVTDMPAAIPRPVPAVKPQYPRDISDQYSETVQGIPIINSPKSCGQGELEIRVKAKGIKYGKGLIVADLHNDIAEDFLKWDKVVLRVRVPAKEGETEFCVPITQPGEYALGIYHDKNSNRKFDKGFLKIPKERFGMSNNPKFKLKAPEYEESAFRVGPDGADIEIQLFQSGDILRQNK